MTDFQDDRIIDRLDIYARSKALNDNRITKDAGLSVGLLGKYRKAGKDMTRKAAAKILAAYPDINKEWFLTGQGANATPDETPTSYPSYPFFDVSLAECGKAEGLAEAARLEDLPRISLPGIPRDTEFFIQTTGHSMINAENPNLSIPPASLVGLSKVVSGIIRWGEVYALVTADGIMLKRLFPADNEPDAVKCVSYNSSEFPPFTISKNEIKEVARITCVVPIMLR